MDFKNISNTNFIWLRSVGKNHVLCSSSFYTSGNMGHFFVIRHPEPNSYREQQPQRPHTSLIVNTTHVSTYGFVLVDLICPALSETHSSVRALLAVSAHFSH